ncbi:MAG: alpha/beta hydrolase fold domain-containing protein [Bacteroidales bacterium]|nr:alpha/beta hydrolase fold domain-containing protein [Bacteroidales bacterium]
MSDGFVSPGKRFTDRYLQVMFSSLRDATPEQVQEELELCRNINRKPVRVPRYFKKSFSETSFKAANGFNMQVFSTPHYPKGGDGLVLYLHGGACIYQPVFFHWRFVHDLAVRTHDVFLMPIYPKAPEYQCAFNMEVMMDFYEREVLPRKAKRVILMGDSIGACIALTMAQEIHRRGWTPINGLVMVSPSVDITYPRVDQMMAIQPLDTMLKLDRIQTLMNLWRGDLPANHPWASPIYGDLTCLPERTVLVYGGHEILKVDAEMLVEKLQQLGRPIFAKEYDGMFHTFPMFPVKEGFDAIREIVRRTGPEKPRRS